MLAQNKPAVTHPKVNKNNSSIFTFCIGPSSEQQNRWDQKYPMECFECHVSEHWKRHAEILYRPRFKIEAPATHQRFQVMTQTFDECRQGAGDPNFQRRFDWQKNSYGSSEQQTMGANF